MNTKDGISKEKAKVHSCEHWGYVSGRTLRMVGGVTIVWVGGVVIIRAGVGG